MRFPQGIGRFRSQWLPSPPQDTFPPVTTGRRLKRHLGGFGSKAAIVNGRPFEADGLMEIHIVESWESPDHWNKTKGNTTRTIHVYSNAPMVELFVVNRAGNRKPRSYGKRNIVPMVKGDGGTYGEWQNIPWKPGSLLAIAQSVDGMELARTRRDTNHIEPRVSLLLSLDCPSTQTGTGLALFLDGSDVALVRATLINSETNNTLVFTSNLVRFSVVEGPGRILGTANGDPKSKLSHTLVRAVVGVTSIVGWTSEEKDLLRSMEVPEGDDGDAAAPFYSEDDEGTL
jgi:hypothetical protein